MAIDLAQFHDAFFDESFEALDTMEASLLKLNIGAPEPELINTIFRVAHSIKGGSATFGFTEVASFTHTCETLLDELRGNRMNVTRAITDLLLRSVDVMREMLRAVQHKTPVDAHRVADLQFDLELAIIQKDSAPAAPAPSAPVAAAPAAAAPAKAGAKTSAAHRWLIQFRPYPQLLVHGNDPLRMLRELAELGDLTVTVDASNLPPLPAMEAESCFFSWELRLETEATREVIEQIFDWAEGDCDLKIQEEGATAAAAPVKAAAEGKPAEASRPQLAAVPTPEAPLEAPKAGLGDGSSIRVSTEKIDELMNAVGELVITQSMLTQLGA
jgi:two-component system chemotaxis sensor kinase CheA